MILKRRRRVSFLDAFPAVSIVGVDRHKAAAPGSDMTVAMTFQSGNMSATYQVALSFSSCHFGGHRRWLLCPGCGARRRELLVAGLTLGCRGCFGTRYRSAWRWPRLPKELRRPYRRRATILPVSDSHAPGETVMPTTA